MAFTLENPVVEFTAKGIADVLAQAAKATAAVENFAASTSRLEKSATAFAVVNGVASEVAAILPNVATGFNTAATAAAHLGEQRTPIAQLAVELAKIKKSVTDATTAMAPKASKGGFFAGLQSMANEIIGSFSKQSLGKGLSTFETSLGTLTPKLTAATNALAQTTPVVNSFTVAVPAASSATRQLAVDMGALRSNSSGAAKSLTPLTAVMARIAKDAGGAATGTSSMMKSITFGASARGTKAFEAALTQIKPKSDLANSALAVLTPTLAGYTQHAHTAAITTRDFARSLAEVKSGSTGQSQQVGSLADAMKKLATATAGTAGQKGGLRGFFSGFTPPNMGGFSSQLSGIKSQLLGIVGVTSVGALGAGVLKLAADAETLQVSFETLLGSSSQAKTMVKDLQKLAAETPLSEMGVGDAAKKMLAFGFAAESIIPMLATVGDAATSIAGGGAAGEEALAGVVRALGQIKQKGKVQAEEFNQLAERGIGAWDMLATAMGVSVAEAQKQVTAGSVSAQVGIDSLMKGMQEKFGGGMKRMSQTSAGLFSTLIDSFRSLGRNIGEPFQPFVKSALKAGIEATSSLQAVIMPSVRVLQQALGKELKLNIDANSVTAIGDTLASITQTVVDGVSSIKNWLLSLSPTVLKFGGAFASILPLVSAFSTGMSLLAPVLAVLLNPVGLITTGVVALGVALSQNKGIATAFGNATKAAFELVTSAWQAASEMAGELWAAIGETGAWDAIQTGIKGTMNWIASLMTDVAFMARNWKQSAVIVGESVKLMWDNTKQAFRNIGQNFFDFIAALESFANGEGFNFQWTGLAEGFENSTQRMQNAISEMQANEEKRLKDQADAQRKVAEDSVVATQETENKKEQIRKAGADSNAETQDKIKRDMQSTSISWVDVADRIKAGFDTFPKPDEPSLGRSIGEAADKNMMQAAKDSLTGFTDAQIAESQAAGFSDGNESARRRAAIEEAAAEAATVATPDEQGHKLLQEVAKIQEQMTQLMTQLVTAATSTGLKIEPQPATLG